MAIKYSLTNCTWYASQCKPAYCSKKEADAFKNLQWKTLKGINIPLVYYIWYISIIYGILI